MRMASRSQAESPRRKAGLSHASCASSHPVCRLPGGGEDLPVQPIPTEVSMARPSWTGLRVVSGAALVAALLAAAGIARAEEVPPQFPVTDFFANPERAYFRLSEDGRTLGFMQPVAAPDGGRRLNVFVQPLQGSKPVGQPRQLTRETARDINLYYWKGSHTILYDKD